MKYYRTVINGHMQLWKTLKDIPKGAESFDMEVPTDKDGLHELLTDLLDRLYAAEKHTPPTIDAVSKEAELTMALIDNKKLSYTEKSVMIDEEWENLALIRKLGLASDLMEQARGALIEANKGRPSQSISQIVEQDDGQVEE